MRNRTLKPIVFTLALVPLLRLLWLGFVDGLGANPIATITHQTGLWTLTLLLVTLAITPARRITGQLWLIQYRRMLGLFAFFYAVLHMLTYVWLDQFFDFHAMYKDIVKRPFITMGSAAFLMLVPLALTSTQSAIRRLGRHWQQLHRLVYFSAVAGVIHFIWLVKKDIRQPLLYAYVLAALLGYRVFAAVRKRYNSWQTARAASRVAEKHADAVVADARRA
jgi:sulfoxide reductase heme-binding subunit YedZ